MLEHRPIARSGIRRLVALGVAFTAVLGVAACSDDDADTTEGQTSEATTGATWSGPAPNMDPASDETAAEWQALFEGALASAPGTPGVWVSVSHPELGRWTAAIGDAVLDTQPATTDDHLRIGSITKTFTAAAVLEQVDQGAMSLDDTVEGVVPELAEQFPETAALTVDQLLGMESGLGDYANVPGAATAQAVADPTKVWTPEELIESALAASPVQPVGTPGYSTTNYTILGRMLEAVTGELVEDTLTDLAQRAGLEQTALLPGDQNDMPDPSSHGYIDVAGVGSLEEIGVEVEAGTDTTDWSVSWGGAGGGMYSVIDDLFAWTASAMGTNLLSEDLAAERLTFDVAIEEAGINYGLGIFELVQVPGWVGHTGQVIGWESLGMYDPETGGTVAIITNGTAALSAFVPVWAEIFGLTLG